MSNATTSRAAQSARWWDDSDDVETAIADDIAIGAISMEDINNSYHYKKSYAGGWQVLNLVDGQCQPFPETENTRVIACETEQEARSCAGYYVIKFGGDVTRGGK